MREAATDAEFVKAGQEFQRYVVEHREHSLFFKVQNRPCVLNQSTGDWYNEVRRKVGQIRITVPRVCQCHVVRFSLHFGPRLGIERCGKINAVNSSSES